MLKDIKKKIGEEDFVYSGVIDDKKTEEIVTKIQEKKNFESFEFDSVEISEENFLKILNNLNDSDQLLNYMFIKDLKNKLTNLIIYELNKMLKNFVGNKVSFINCGIDFTILAPILNLFQINHYIEEYDLSGNPEIDSNCHSIIIKAISSCRCIAQKVTIDQIKGAEETGKVKFSFEE